MRFEKAVRVVASSISRELGFLTLVNGKALSDFVQLPGSFKTLFERERCVGLPECQGSFCSGCNVCSLVAARACECANTATTGRSVMSSMCDRQVPLRMGCCIMLLRAAVFFIGNVYMTAHICSGVSSRLYSCWTRGRTHFFSSSSTNVKQRCNACTTSVL